MAKITLDLSKFKASGIYTLEYDQSESIILNTQTVRLIVGFSRKGPFNAPVYLPDKKTAKRVFGDVDPFLERRGAFFHRAIYTALEVGPVFGLNLMPLNNDPDLGDKVPYMSYSLSTTEANGKKVYKLYASFYNKEGFWFPDQEYFLGNVNSAGSINTGKLFNITNLGQVPVSIIVRKKKVTGFDITAREWYKASNVPSFIDGWDYISDYFIELTVVQGNWTDYQQLSIDPVFSEYFDVRGLRKDQIEEFLNAPEVETLGTFVGSIIPDLVDGTGSNHSIDTIVNQYVASTGIFIAIDKESLEEYDVTANDDDDDQISAVDVIGHNFAAEAAGVRDNPDIINFLSYKTTIKETLSFTFTNSFTEDYIRLADGMIKTASVHKGGNYGYFDNILVIEKPPYSEDAPVLHPNLLKYVEMRNLLVPNQSLLKLNPDGSTVQWALIDSVYEETDVSTGKIYLKILYKHPEKQSEKNIVGFTFGSCDYDTATFKVTLADVPTAEKANFKEANLPDVGQDMLIKNTDTKTWYYVKVASVVAGSTTTYGSETVLSEATFTVEDASVLKKWDSDYTDVEKQPTGYKVYWKATDYVKINDVDIDGDAYPGSGALYAEVNFVREPDVCEFYDYSSGGSHDDSDSSTPDADKPNMIRAYKYSKLYQYWENGALLAGDKWYYDNDASSYYYLDYVRDIDTNGIPCLEVYAYDTYVDGKLGRDTSAVTPAYGFEAAENYYRQTDGTYILSSTALGDDPGDIISIYVVADDLYDSIPVLEWDSSKTTIVVKEDYHSDLQVGHYLVSEIINEDSTRKYKLTKITSKKKVYNDLIDGWAYEYEVNQPLYLSKSGADWVTVRYYPIDEFINYYQFTHLDGFKINDYHLPGGTYKATQLEKIISMLDPENSNLMEMLKSRDIITFRYLVDTFDGGLNTYTYPKNWFTRLAAERQKCLAIMNAPSIKEFMNSNDPRFTEEPTRVDPKPILNTAYIADGGNLSLGPSTTFSLPDEFWGSKFSGYFTPFLTIRENGKNFNIPPAAHVSNLFVQKFINGTPYAIVAGPKRGVISEPKMVGLEYDFLLKDREYIEPFGLNPIVKKKGVGYMIFGNQMAYQKTHSAFNNLHVRDLLITIEESIEDILANFLYDFNDNATRLQIKTIVETYMDSVRANGGVYDFMVILDDTNNPSDIIDQNIGIVDVAVEPVRGLHKFINRITVLKTGGVSSGGFTPY